MPKPDLKRPVEDPEKIKQKAAKRRKTEEITEAVIDTLAKIVRTICKENGEDTTLLVGEQPKQRAVRSVSAEKIFWDREPFLTMMRDAMKKVFDGGSVRGVSDASGIPERTLRRWVTDERAGRRRNGILVEPVKPAISKSPAISKPPMKPKINLSNFPLDDSKKKTTKKKQKQSSISSYFNPRIE